MTSPVLLTRRRAASRLRRILEGPSSTRTSSVQPFETGLLRAWRGDEATDRPADDDVSTTQRSAIEAARALNARLTSAHDTEGFLLEVFRVLPDPVLLSTPAGMLWNHAFGRELAHENDWQRGLPSERRIPVLRRFRMILERARPLGARALLVPLGEHAFRARLLYLSDDASAAMYLRRVDVEMGDLPPEARIIGLYKAAGLAHKQIAELCAERKSRVDHVASRYRSQFRSLRSSLCRVPNR